MPETRYRDDALIELLVKRDGIATVAVLEDGTEYTIFNIAWGYDLGDQYAHITTNISPSIEGTTINFFVTNELIGLFGAECRQPLINLPI